MRADFSGTWKLIRGESDFGFLAPPQWRVDKISHEGCSVRIRTRQKDANGDITVDRDLTIGGDPITLSIRGRERKIIAFWEDTVLVVETRSEISGNPRRIEDRLSLDEGGSWLTIERLHHQPGGSVRQRLRLRRELGQDGGVRGTGASPMVLGPGIA